MKLEPVSLLAGAVLLGLMLLSTGAVQTPGSRTAVPIPAPATLGRALTIKGIPTPDQLVHLSKKDGDLPYVVPEGQVLVVTRASLKAAGCDVLFPSALGMQRITFDGACVWSFFHDLYDVSQAGQQHYTFGTDLGAGIAAPAGTVVDISGQGPTDEAVVLLGYLADA